MAIAVVTTASGGMPVIDVTATEPGLGVPVTEATNGRGIAVTKVSLAIGGLPVTFVWRATSGRLGVAGRRMRRSMERPPMSRYPMAT